VITGNVLFDHAQNGLLLADPDSLVAGNLFFSNGSSSYHFDLEAQSGDNLVYGNDFLSRGLREYGSNNEFCGPGGEANHYGAAVPASAIVPGNPCSTAADPVTEGGQDPDGDGVITFVDNCPTDWNPGQEDADGNGVGDACQALDPESGALALGEAILGLDLNLFEGRHSEQAQAGKRSALADRAQRAAGAIAGGDFEEALETLRSLLLKIDDQAPPPDWMAPSPEKTSLADDTRSLIEMLESESVGSG
jgi:hypothetical protein